jgi:hypothetical protein
LKWVECCAYWWLHMINRSSASNKANASVKLSITLTRLACAAAAFLAAGVRFFAADAVRRSL